VLAVELHAEKGAGHRVGPLALGWIASRGRRLLRRGPASILLLFLVLSLSFAAAPSSFFASSSVSGRPSFNSSSSRERHLVARQPARRLASATSVPPASTHSRSRVTTGPKGVRVVAGGHHHDVVAAQVEPAQRGGADDGHGLPEPPLEHPARPAADVLDAGRSHSSATRAFAARARARSRATSLPPRTRVRRNRRDAVARGDAAEGRRRVIRFSLVRTIAVPRATLVRRGGSLPRRRVSSGPRRGPRRRRRRAEPQAGATHAGGASGEAAAAVPARKGRVSPAGTAATLSHWTSNSSAGSTRSRS